MSRLIDLQRRTPSGGGGGGGGGGSGILFSSLGAADGDAIVIPNGVTVLLDIDTPNLASLTINAGGTFRNQSNTSATLTAGSILNSGSFLFENDGATPYTGAFNIVLNGLPWVGRIVGANSSTTAGDNSGSQRAFLNMAGSVVRLRGNTPSVFRSKLNANASAGATSITLADAVFWKAGQKVAIGPTGFVQNMGSTNRTTQHTVAADTNGSNVVTLTTPLTFARWGQLQYATDSGLSLTPGPTTTKPDPSIPEILDERASVFLLDRNIGIRGVADSNWTTLRFGGHCMVMGINSEAFIDGVEFERMGQGGTLGRYPWHWHMPSYDPTTGANLGTYAANMAVMQNCSVHNSPNRVVSVHGTRGAVVKHNTGYDIRGHAFFLEDGSEELNVIDGNWAYFVNAPDWLGGSSFASAGTWAIKNHDKNAAGFWITNPNNDIINNVAGDAVNGVWNAPQFLFGNPINGSDSFTFIDSSYVGGCLGLSKKVAIYPYFNAIKNWTNNTGHSCMLSGAKSNDFAKDEAGNTTQGKIQSTDNNFPGPPYGNPHQIDSLFTGTIVWKNSGGSGYNNRISGPHYVGWTGADNPGDVFQGQTDTGIAENHLLIARSLNIEADANSGQPSFFAGFATYHGTLLFRNIWGFNFQGDAPIVVQLDSSGPSLRATALSESWDLYLSPCFKYFTSCYGWSLVNSIPMFRTPPPHIWQDGHYGAAVGSNGAGLVQSNGHIFWNPYTLAGALYDAYGTLANDGSKAGQYVVYNHPFLTFGLADTSPVMPSLPYDSGTVTTPTPFYGLRWHGDDSEFLPFTFNSQHAVFQQVNKADNSLVAGAIWEVPSEWGAVDNTGTTANTPGSLISPFSTNEYPHGYPAGQIGGNSQNPGPFHHVAIAKGQRVLCTLLNRATPNSSRVVMRLSNVQRSIAGGAASADVIEFGFAWDGSVPAFPRAATDINLSTGDWYPTSFAAGFGLDLSTLSVANLAAFNAATSSCFWQDTASNMVWVKFYSFYTTPEDLSDTADVWFQCNAS